MLKSNTPAKRLFGLEATVQTDFLCIFPDLLAFLERETEPELIQSCLSLIVANPTMEALFSLPAVFLRIPEMQNQIRVAVTQIRKLFIVSGMADETEIEKFLASRRRKMQAKAEIPKQEKELLQLKSAIKWKSTEEVIGSNYEKIQSLLQHIVKLLQPVFEKPAYLIVPALVVIIIFAFAGKPDKPKQISQPLPAKPAATTSTSLPVLPVSGENLQLTLADYDEVTKTWLANDQNGNPVRIYQNKSDWQAGGSILVKVRTSLHSITGQPVIVPE